WLTPNQAAVWKAIEKLFDGQVGPFARRTGFTRQAVYAWFDENEPKDPDAKSIRRIEEALGISLRALFAPKPEAIYWRGAEIAPGDPIHDRITHALRLELRAARPDLAEILDL